MKIPVHNKTKMPIYVGAAMVLPGETRHFEEQDVPPNLRPAPVEDAPVEVPADQLAEFPLIELLLGNVKEVTAALAGMTTADVEKLGELEQAGHARKGVLSAVGEMLLNRAAQADMLAKVAAFNDEELAAALEDAKTDINVDADYLAALEAEAAKRNPGSVE